jgi:hypothetical protein
VGEEDNEVGRVMRRIWRGGGEGKGGEGGRKLVFFTIKTSHLVFLRW